MGYCALKAKGIVRVADRNLIGAKERSDSMAMTVVDKDCTEKAEDFTDHLLNMGYTKGIKDGYTKAITEFVEKLKEKVSLHYVDCDGYFGGIEEEILYAEYIDEIATELKGE